MSFHWHLLFCEFNGEIFIFFLHLDEYSSLSEFWEQKYTETFCWSSGLRTNDKLKLKRKAINNLGYQFPFSAHCTQQQWTYSLWTLHVQVPIKLSHLREDVPKNVRYIWSFCHPALLVVDARSLGLRRKCCKKFYGTLCLLIIFENGIDTFILSLNVKIDLINVYRIHTNV